MSLLAVGNGRPPEGSTQEAKAVAHLAGVLHALLRGMCTELGVPVFNLVTRIMCCVQTRLERAVKLQQPLEDLESGGAPLALSVCNNTSLERILVDTAATMLVVGSDLMHLAQNIRPLATHIRLETANGIVMITHMCDIPTELGLMEGALCVPSSKRSLLDAVGVCVKKKLGLVIDEGGASARYMRGGLVVSPFWNWKRLTACSVSHRYLPPRCLCRPTSVAYMSVQ